MLYTDYDDCVYPAQLFPNSVISYKKKKEEILNKVKARREVNGVFIERNVGYLYDTNSEMRFTNYWMLLKDAKGLTIGVIGI